MLSTIMGYIALAALVLFVVGVIILFVGLHKEDATIKAKASLLMALSFLVFIPSGITWVIFWLVSLFA